VPLTPSKSESEDEAEVVEEIEAFAPSGIVAIVGRPNVGKSTLFNRLTGLRDAIVDEEPGLTRDRLYGVVEWNGRQFTLIDTAGIDRHTPKDASLAEISRGAQAQAKQAIEEADLICFVVDVRAGVTTLDEEVADVLRKGRKPIILCANKSDTPAVNELAADFYSLGFDQPMTISALSGIDTGDLLDRMVEMLPERQDVLPPSNEIRIAIIGRPNVGKSSLLNAVVGTSRSLVTSVAGTTRDAIDTVFEWEGQAIRLVDTAGIRKRGVIDSPVEHYSVLRALRAVERCDLAIVVVDTHEGIFAQDRHIAGYAVDAGKGVVVAANKWDLLTSEIREDPETLKAIRRAFSFVPGIPVIAISATEHRSLDKLLMAAEKVAAARAMHVPTSALNDVIADLIEKHPPPAHKGRALRIYYATQVGSETPTIVLFVNNPALMHFSYKRYIENEIRAVFGFAGSRIRILVRKRTRSEDRE
jgi:GTP-binding protein